MQSRGLEWRDSQTSLETTMTITVNATFENGQLKLKEPVALAEGTAVRVAITPVAEEDDPLSGVIGICKGGQRDGAEHHDEYIYDQEFEKRSQGRGARTQPND
jgi:predicted DNA-binding antitoxin AbrB/MazE fold protein